jgi:hypothetical protein
MNFNHIILSWPFLAPLKLREGEQAVNSNAGAS